MPNHPGSADASAFVLTAGELLDEVPCGIVSFDDAGVITAVNATLATMLGMDRDAMAGQSIESVLSVPTRIFYQTHFFPLLRLHGRADEVYLTLRSASGEPVHVLANAVRREGPAPVNHCVFMRIRERQKFEEELLRARKAAEEASASKSRFLAMMSHDLRTPLGAVAGYADLLLLGVRGPVTDTQAKDLNRIKAASRFLLNMMDEILTFARAERREVTITLCPVPLRAAVTEVESLLSLQYREAGVSLLADAIPAWQVRADPDRLRQILLNLLSNAAKFTPQGGRVTITCAESDDQVQIRVADTGRGIPAGVIGRIFEPFVQVDRDRDSANRKGMGLGLAISRELARAMSGDLTVESTLGEGSTFTLSLPRASEGHDPAP